MSSGGPPAVDSDPLQTGSFAIRQSIFPRRTLSREGMQPEAGDELKSNLAKKSWARTFMVDCRFNDRVIALYLISDAAVKGSVE